MDITVLGCGVIGLTTALRLTEDGHRVTIRTWKVPPETTSDKAAAFWSPYRITEDGQTFAWIAETYRTLAEFSRIPGSGVSMVPLRKFLKDGRDTSDNWWLKAIPGEHYTSLNNGELPPGYTAGWKAEVPLMETPLYLPFLMDRFRAGGGRTGGGRIITGEKVTTLSAFSGSLVVNCTGLGSRDLCGDEALLPVRGQIAVTGPLPLDGIYVDADTPIYLVPRADGCIIGGTYERDNWEDTPEPETINEIVQRAKALTPDLTTGPAIRSYAGLRPYRPSVRLEADPAQPGLIHHYGHGGAGFTVSWGAATSVAALVRSLDRIS
ncbi:FAD-dependent oxidoreductase [Dinghuibacter silviterrae]|uniref:D-amino-acid oxidase n=1 Tax=Dinghuibacter silviterrae TaxID=1539049 RepID=A0A4R8DUE6_9BACT|nr:FAD-dependent oxidoreductase [Dinghuibacter silviterrae]TDX01037.1 D-amino-acid:oxygen oxidoreductase (deaminating) [Dinghuibacter silviterrae]